MIVVRCESDCVGEEVTSDVGNWEVNYGLDVSQYLGYRTEISYSGGDSVHDCRDRGEIRRRRR